MTYKMEPGRVGALAITGLLAGVCGAKRASIDVRVTIPNTLVFCSAGSRILTLSWLDALAHQPRMSAALAMSRKHLRLRHLPAISTACA